MKSFKQHLSESLEFDTGRDMKLGGDYPIQNMDKGANYNPLSTKRAISKKKSPTKIITDPHLNESKLSGVPHDPRFWQMKAIHVKGPNLKNGPIIRATSPLHHHWDIKIPNHLNEPEFSEHTEAGCIGHDDKYYSMSHMENLINKYVSKHGMPDSHARVNFSMEKYR